jgi:ureidoglycolate lyase
MHIFTIEAEPFTKEAFAPYGEILEPGDTAPDTNITLMDKGHLRMEFPETFDKHSKDFDVLEVWRHIATISEDPMSLSYHRLKHREFSFSLMERHLKGTQTWFPTGSIAASVFAVAPPSDLSDPNAVPDLNRMKAFILDGKRGMNIHVGTWHWTPFPLADCSEFITLVRKRAVEEDLNFVNLPNKLDTIIKITL